MVARIYRPEISPLVNIAGAIEGNAAKAMDESGIERRAVPRHKVLKRGTLALHGGGAIDCMVRNISSNGARIEIAVPVGLPECFTLVIESDQFQRRCHQVWSREKRIGVAFD